MTNIIRRTTRLVLSLLVGLGILFGVAGPAMAGPTPEERCTGAGGLDVLAWQTKDAFYTTPGTTLTIKSTWTKGKVVSDNYVGRSFIELSKGKTVETLALHYEAPAGRTITSYVVCGVLPG